MTTIKIEDWIESKLDEVGYTYYDEETIKEGAKDIFRRYPSEQLSGFIFGKKRNSDIVSKRPSFVEKLLKNKIGTEIKISGKKKEYKGIYIGPDKIQLVMKGNRIRIRSIKTGRFVKK